jgi:hypothetical protein
LIDFENIAAGTEKEGLGRFNVEALMERFKDKGRVLVARSYADWGRFSRFKQGLLTENVTMMELTSHGMQDKNRADIALVVDALELAFTKDYVDTFVIVSGDSDFTPMVQKMRELNKRVIGCGTRKSTSRLLVYACDEFIFYDSIVKATATRTKTRGRRNKEGGKLNLNDAFDLLTAALAGLQRENPDPPLAGITKQAMLRKSPDFSETELGFGGFARFLEAAQKAGHVTVIRDRKSGGYRVDAADGSGERMPVATEPRDDADASTWTDQYLPEGTETWVAALNAKGMHPLGASTRLAVLEAIEESVTARKKRRRKTNSHFVAEDAKKALRRTHPELPLNHIRGIMTALREADLLVHRDGQAVRTASATFRLEKNATELNDALLPFWLRRLAAEGCELTDSAKLAELFLGDGDRNRQVEEAIAWLATADLGAGDEPELNDVNLDDLLLVSSDDAPPAADVIEAPAPEVDEAPVEEAPAAEEEAPVDEPAEDAAEEPPAEKPKRRTRRRVRKKADPKADAPATLDDATLDSLLSTKD